MADRTQITKEALKFIAEAEEDKRLHEVWHREGYRYTMPWRKRPGDDTQDQPLHDQDELFDATGIQANSDFAADCQNDFTPVEKDWLLLEAAKNVPIQDKARIDAAIKNYQTTVFSEIGRGNFHEASQ